MSNEKTYTSPIPNSTFICSKGIRHSFGGSGKLVTADVRVQKELEEAAASGAPISVGAVLTADKAIPVMKQSDAAAALEALKAAGKA